jgi:hypothetical protein
LTGANVSFLPSPGPFFLLISRKTDQLFMSVWDLWNWGNFYKRKTLFSS